MARYFILLLGALVWLGTGAIQSLGADDVPTRSEADITIVGVAADGTYNITTPEPNLTWPILVRRNDSGAEKDIRIDITPFTGPSGQRYSARLNKDGAAFD